MRRRFSTPAAERPRFTRALLPSAEQPESGIARALAWKFYFCLAVHTGTKFRHCDNGLCEYETWNCVERKPVPTAAEAINKTEQQPR